MKWKPLKANDLWSLESDSASASAQLSDTKWSDPDQTICY